MTRKTGMAERANVLVAVGSGTEGKVLGCALASGAGPEAASIEGLIEAADRAPYQAKAAGRNLVRGPAPSRSGEGGSGK